MDSHDDKTQYAILCEPAEAKKIVPPRININGSVDPFYRYKMSSLIASVTNAHASKMVKTSLINIDTVSNQLQRPSSYLTNFIGYSLSAKSEYSAKKPEGENAYVSGNLKNPELSNLVRAFIKDWVLCPKCSNPEINLRVKNKKGGNGTIKLECSACGYRGSLKSSIFDSQPKMCAHVFNNPPKKSTGTQKIESSVAKTQHEPTDMDGAGGKKKKKDKKKKKSSGEETLTPRSDGGSPKAAAEAAEPEVETSPLEQLQGVLAAESCNDTALRSCFKKAAKGLEAPEAFVLLLRALSSQGAGADAVKSFIKAFKTYEKTIKKAVGKDVASIGPAVMAWYEDYGVANIAEAKLLPKALHTMYEADIAEEEAILAWHKASGAGSSKELRELVQPIIDWLEEAESEEESDED